MINKNIPSNSMGRPPTPENYHTSPRNTSEGSEALNKAQITGKESFFDRGISNGRVRVVESVRKDSSASRGTNTP